MQPNDWLCPNSQCINATKGVFARHSSCPKCGAPRGMTVAAMGMGGGGGQRSGDWLCPNGSCINATRAVFAKHSNCPQCNAPKENATPIVRPSSSPGLFRSNDWLCPTPGCINATKGVFARHSTCPKCGASKEEADGSQIFDGGGCQKVPGQTWSYTQAPQADWAQTWTPPTAFMGWMGAGCAATGQMGRSGPGGSKAEDWSCPNTGCINATKGVFGKHAACPKCGSPKPGDWPCPNIQCINNSKGVFARNSTCPKCGCARPGTAAALMQHSFGRSMGGMGMSGMGMGVSGHSVNPSDWRCPDPDCINNKRLVFGKNTNCPQCGAEKPLHPVPSQAGNTRPGDWKCPNEACRNHTNMVFSKKLTCPSCGADKPFEDSEDGGRARSRSPR